MNIITTIEDMQRWSEEQRKAGKTVGFVPTMGALHEGHLSLVREAKKKADAVVVSIYVNPTQFGADEDLANYPRDLDADAELCKAAGADVIFAPTDEVMYPDGKKDYVEVEHLGTLLCGKTRPIHFRGVTTVCAKFFDIIKPNVAVFGEKDYQQLVVIRKLVEQLGLSIEIVGGPIVREDDGLAMSSRNAYLSEDERVAARSLNKSLKVAKELVANGERDTSKIKGAVVQTIESTKIPKIDYVHIVDSMTLEDTTELPARLCIAAFVGQARLIDNCPLK
jgi:pantoate--beta-alanine ligase